MKMVRVTWNSRDDNIDVELMNDDEIKEFMEMDHQYFETKEEEVKGIKCFSYYGDTFSVHSFDDNIPDYDCLMWIVHFDRSEHPDYEVNTDAIYRIHKDGKVFEIPY